MTSDRALAPTLRPYLPADAARCAAIFRDSIETLASDDYGEDQRRVWAAMADDVAAFGRRLAQALTLVAVASGQTVGFATLKGADIVEMLYVDPGFARRGIGAALIDALTRLATARGARTIALDTTQHKLYLPAARFEETSSAASDEPKGPIVPGSFFVLVVDKGTPKEP